jgi:hypothetical protein
VAVSNLQAVARFGTARLRGVALDARRGEIYGAVYDDAGKLVTEEVVAKLGPWLETLPAGVEEFLSNDLTISRCGNCCTPSRCARRDIWKTYRNGGSARRRKRSATWRGLTSRCRKGRRRRRTSSACWTKWARRPPWASPDRGSSGS